MVILAAVTEIQPENINAGFEQRLRILSSEELDGPSVATILVICVRRMNLPS